MALESGLLTSVGPNETKRQYHAWMEGTSVLASGAMNSFVTGNVTGCILMVKATSVAGTPNYTLTLQTAFEDVDATYTNVDAICRPDFIAINDENYHVWTVNFANCMQYARFYITLNPGDGADDKFYFHTCFMYGDFQHATDVSLEMPVVTLGSVKLEDGVTAANKADVNDANTARTTGTHVVATQNVDANGKVLNVGTAAMAASAPVTMATDDTQFGAVGAASDVDGNLHGQLRYIGETANAIEGDTTSIDNKTPALGAAAMVAASPVTLATDDTHYGAVGAASDVDGVVHGQLRYIGEAVANIPVAGAALMAGSTPVTLATDDTHFGSVGAAADVDGVIHAQLRHIGEAVDGIPALGSAAMAGSTPMTVATDDTQFGAVGEAASSTGGLHAQLRAIYDSVETLEGREFYKVVATGSGAIALTSAAGHLWELNSVTIHFDTAPATSENLDIILDSTDGAGYDTKLLTVDPSTGSLGDITFVPCNPMLLAAGDEIVVSFTNTDARTYGVRIVGTKLA